MAQVNEYIYNQPVDYNLSASANDLAISSNYCHIIATTNLNITGLQSPVVEDHNANVIIENDSGAGIDITLKDNDAGSAVGNRFLFGADKVLTPGQYTVLMKVSAGYLLILIY